jgi:hypothetical protein
MIDGFDMTAGEARLSRWADWSWASWAWIFSSRSIVYTLFIE